MDYTQTLEVTYEQLQQKLAECQSKLAGLEPRWFDVTETVRSYGTSFYVFGSVSIVKITQNDFTRSEFMVKFEQIKTKFRFPDIDDVRYPSGPAATKAVEACYQVMKQEESDYVSRV